MFGVAFFVEPFLPHTPRDAETATPNACSGCNGEETSEGNGSCQPYFKWQTHFLTLEEILSGFSESRISLWA